MFIYKIRQMPGIFLRRFLRPTTVFNEGREKLHRTVSLSKCASPRGSALVLLCFTSMKQMKKREIKNCVAYRMITGVFKQQRSGGLIR
jgi:hypothetical protein